MYNKRYSKKMNELILCAICQDFGINFGDWTGIDLSVYLRLRKIEGGDENGD